MGGRVLSTEHIFQTNNRYLYELNVCDNLYDIKLYNITIALYSVVPQSILASYARLFILNTLTIN